MSNRLRRLWSGNAEFPFAVAPIIFNIDLANLKYANFGHVCRYFCLCWETSVVIKTCSRLVQPTPTSDIRPTQARLITPDVTLNNQCTAWSCDQVKVPATGPLVSRTRRAFLIAAEQPTLRIYANSWISKIFSAPLFTLTFSLLNFVICL